MENRPDQVIEFFKRADALDVSCEKEDDSDNLLEIKKGKNSDWLFGWEDQMFEEWRERQWEKETLEKGKLLKGTLTFLTEVKRRC